MFCTLFICFVLDGLLQSISFLMFYSKYLITFENTYLLSVDFTVLTYFTYFTWNLDSVKCSQ